MPILSFVWLTVTIVIAGSLYPEYSHKTQFISELGATGSPHGTYVNYLGFLPAVFFILAFVFLSFPAIPKTIKNTTGLVFIATYGLTLSVAALSPCDFECRPVDQSLSHRLHMFAAFSGYLCGIMAIFIISSGSSVWLESKSFKISSYSIGILCICALLNLDPNSNFVGIFQRSLELMIYSWLIYFSYSLSAYLTDKSTAV